MPIMIIPEEEKRFRFICGELLLEPDYYLNTMIRQFNSKCLNKFPEIAKKYRALNNQAPLE